MRRVGMAVIGWLEALTAAFQFLTRLPLPVRISYTDVHFRRSVVFYPLAGLVIGLLLLAAGSALGGILPPTIAGIVLAGVWTMISGGLHLDGLMDTADGLLSHRSRERMLEIMKDSRVGAMGVIVCVFYVLLKASAATYLLEKGGMEELLLLSLVPVWSRSFLAAALARWPYARTEQGLGSLYRSVSARHAWAAGAAALLISAAVLLLAPGWNGNTLEPILLLAVVAYATGYVFASSVSRKLGGLTGDVYGATNEMIELVLLLCIAGSLYNGA